jgi:hypothetical protein
MTSLSLVVKGIKSERKTKRKKKGVRIQAILGRIRTPDPDPGHFGPDFYSGSELESAFADPSPCASLTHSRLRTFYGLFTDLSDFPDSVFLPGRYATCVCVKRGDHVQ